MIEEKESNENDNENENDIDQIDEETNDNIISLPDRNIGSQERELDGTTRHFFKSRLSKGGRPDFSLNKVARNQENKRIMNDNETFLKRL